MPVAGLPSTPVSLDTFLSDLEGASWNGSDADLASFIMAEQIKYQDGTINQKLSELRLAKDGRQAINGRMQQLRKMLNAVKAEHPGEKGMDVKVPESKLRELVGDADFVGTQLDMKLHYDTGKVELLEGKTFSTATKAKNLGGPENPKARQAVEAKQAKWVFERGRFVAMGKEPVFTGNQIEGEIKRLELVAQQLDSEREMMMLKLNSDIGKRSNYIQWLSNMAKKGDDAMSGIVSNLR